MNRPLPVALVAAVAVLGIASLPSSGSAALLVHEGFDYGLSNGEMMAGLATGENSAGSTDSTTDLTFSNLATGGGSAILTSTFSIGDVPITVPDVQINACNWAGAGSQEGTLENSALASAARQLAAGTFDFNDSSFAQLGLSSSGDAETAKMDELDHGTTLADIVPIPEPAVCLLIAVALGASLIFRRRSHLI